MFCICNTLIQTLICYFFILSITIYRQKCFCPTIDTFLYYFCFFIWKGLLCNFQLFIYCQRYCFFFLIFFPTSTCQNSQYTYHQYQSYVFSHCNPCSFRHLAYTPVFHVLPIEKYCQRRNAFLAIFPFFIT